MAEEKPNIEEPKVEEPKEQPQDETETFLSELEKAGVENAEQLRGRLQNAQDFAFMQSERDRMAQELQGLREEMQRLKVAPKTESYDDDYSSGQPIDLESSIEKVLTRVEQKKLKQQQEAMKQQYATWNEIQSDKDYKLVENIWNEKLKDPNLVYQFQMGLKNPAREYQEVVRDYYKTLLQKSAEAIKKLRGGTPQTPTVETPGPGPLRNLRVITRK